ncbi:MAG: flagellar biosynthesis anti-sigma factor FlgM [Lysobacteraceae bacterium]
MTQKIDGGLPRIDSVATSATARAGTDRTTPVAAPEGDSLRLTGEASGLQTLARELGAAPAGIDMAKVHAVRAAIADGSYQVDPAKIADRLLGLERDLAG